MKQVKSCFLMASHVQRDVQDAGLLCRVKELTCSCLHLHDMEVNVVTGATGQLKGS